MKRRAKAARDSPAIRASSATVQRRAGSVCSARRTGPRTGSPDPTYQGGAVAAACYALLAGRERILFYLSGFDAEWSFVSPGTLLLAAMLEEAIAEGRREADFLRGREGYKYAWGGVDRVNGACRLVPVS